MATDLSISTTTTTVPVRVLTTPVYRPAYLHHGFITSMERGVPVDHSEASRKTIATLAKNHPLPYRVTYYLLRKSEAFVIRCYAAALTRGTRVVSEAMEFEADVIKRYGRLERIPADLIERLL